MEQNNNGFLYFIVGALLIAVFGLGYLYVAQDPAAGTNVNVIEPASDRDDTERSDFNLQVDENGISASAESENEDSPN